MRKLLAILFLIALPVWGQVASRDFEHGDSTDGIRAGDIFDSVIAGADEQFTGAIWFKPEDAAAYHYPMTKSSGSGCTPDTNRQFIITVINTGYLRFNYYFSSDSTDRVVGEATTTQFTTGNWYFIVFTYDGTVDTSGMDRAAVYINGVTQSKTTIADTFNAGDVIPVGNAEFGIGNYYNNGTWCTTGTDGLLAYAHFYDRILTAAERESIRYCPGSVTSGLVGYWPLTDSSTQYDLSTNSNNGTNNGTAASTSGPPISTNCAGAGGN